MEGVDGKAPTGVEVTVPVRIRDDIDNSVVGTSDWLYVLVISHSVFLIE